MSSAEVAGAVGVRRLAARAGARLALIQALVVTLAFVLAGSLTQMSVDRLETAALRERVAGEAASLREEFGQRGAGHLPHTVTKRTRLWRGFAYRLERADGAVLGGVLPRPPADGWSEIAGAPGAGDVSRRPYLALQSTLPDGSRLAVAQDLSARVRQSAALTWTLWLCGAIGVAFCVAASTAFTGRAWRRVAAVAAVARAVHGGRLDVRVPTRAGPARDDTDELGQVFNAMLERMAMLLAQVRQVSTDIAHDLRTPLTRVRQRLERLSLEASGDPRLLAGVRRVDEDLAEILRTFDALLQLAEIEVEREFGREDALDLAEVAQRVGEAFRPDIEESGRTLALAIAPARIRGDAHLIAQVTSNLLENALRHTPPGAAIALMVERGPAGEVRLSVADDGPGVPEVERERVLRPLVRLEAGRGSKGSGLGLSIVAAIAHRHRARLHLADARPGLRVTLTFTGQAAAAPPQPARTPALAG